MNKTYRWGIDPDTDKLVIEEDGVRLPSYLTFSVHTLAGLCYFAYEDRKAEASRIHFVETEDAPNPEVVLNIIEAARKAKAAKIAELVKTV